MRPVPRRGVTVASAEVDGEGDGDGDGEREVGKVDAVPVRPGRGDVSGAKLPVARWPVIPRASGGGGGREGPPGLRGGTERGRETIA